MTENEKKRMPDNRETMLSDLEHRLEDSLLPSRRKAIDSLEIGTVRGSRKNVIETQDCSTVFGIEESGTAREHEMSRTKTYARLSKAELLDRPVNDEITGTRYCKREL